MNSFFKKKRDFDFLFYKFCYELYCYSEKRNLYNLEILILKNTMSKIKTLLHSNLQPNKKNAKRKFFLLAFSYISIFFYKVILSLFS